MKHMIRTMVALFATTLLTVSCMDGGYSDMSEVTPQSAYGNDTITERNVVTLQELRTMPKYANTMLQYRDYKLVDDDIQLKLRVVGNDIGGNIYNKVASSL